MSSINEISSLDDLNVEGKTVLVRSDLNVPLKDGQITDQTRLKAAKPTLLELFEKRAKRIVLCSHLGRPKGQVDPNFSLSPLAKPLEEILSCPVLVLNEVVGDSVKEKIESSPQGSVVLIENVRFMPGETKGDLELAKSLASLADVFVLDAFGTAHRAHSSVVGVASYLPSAIGRLMQKELKNLGHLLENPQKPFVTIVGGAKVFDKVDILKSLMDVSDQILIGGAMAYTFLHQQGYAIGNSLCEKDKLDLVQDLFDLAKVKNCQLYLPQDHICGRELSAETEIVSDVSEIPEGFMGLDIGSKTVATYQEIISKAKTLFWNGPMGVFELDPFSLGTQKVAQAAAQTEAFSVVGGGDSLAAVAKFSLEDQFSHVSTGGGASLEFLSGRELPGVLALQKKKVTS